MKDPENYEARAEIMWCGSLSHNGLTGCGICGGDWATHLIEHELGGMFDVAHRAGLAAVWGSWARYVMDEKPERFAQFAVDVMGVEESDDVKSTALKGIEAVEAQQQGVVCVAMDTYESLHYILNDGENGDIVPDTGMLEKKVKQLMNDPALLKRYADKGLQTCRRFDVEAVVDKWETLYKGLI